MKTALEEARTRPYPHLVSTGQRLATRRGILVSNSPLPGVGDDDPLAFIGVGLLDRRGNLSPLGRRTVLDGVTRLAGQTGGMDRCVVWAEDECTWVSCSGYLRHGRTPPKAQDTLDPYLYEQMPLEAEDCWTVELPEGGEHSHLCIRRVDARRIEICRGDQMLLADFSDRIREGERDPAAHLLDAEGRLSPPPVWRGVPVTGVDEWWILGPVQPIEDGIMLRDPSPARLRAACDAMAGFSIPDEVFDRCWRAAWPDLPFIPVGVLEAA